MKIFAAWIACAVLGVAPACGRTQPDEGVAYQAAAPLLHAPRGGAPRQPGPSPAQADPLSAQAPARGLPQLHVLPPPGHGWEPSPPRGPFANVGKTLAEHGIYPRLLFVDEFAANTRGGQGRGHGNSLAFPFGVDLDLDRLVGLAGGTFHLSFNQSIGTSLAAADTFNAVSFQTRYKAYHNLRLSALAYSQDLFDGRLNVTGGRVSALTYFNASPLYCNFQNNAICFNPAVLPIQNKTLSFFPYGTWGGRVKLAPIPQLYFQVGAFEANPALAPTDGFNFSTRTATGVQTAVELGVQSATPLAPHAYHLRFGGFRNDSPVADPYLNTRGVPRPLFGGTPRVHKDGQNGWYAMGDIVVAHLGANPRRNVTLFGGAIGATASYTTFDNQMLLGVIVSGPLANRPDDTFGVVASYIELGPREVAFLQASRAAAGGTDRVRRGEGLVEINYGFQLARGIKLNPNIQYVVHPDNLLKPSAVRQSKDILAFGVRLSVESGAVLGIPVWH